MREKAELTKEEKREERRRRKRQIKSHLHHKSIKHKEGNRAKGIAQGGDRFMAKQLVERMAKKKKGEKKESEAGETKSTKHTSRNFFGRLGDIAK